MRVTTISAAVRYSADTGHGSWKTLELGAEATIDSNENWTVALSCLYDTLVSQFRAKWQNGPTQPAAAPANGQQGDPQRPTPRKARYGRLRATRAKSALVCDPPDPIPV